MTTPATVRPVRPDEHRALGALTVRSYQDLSDRPLDPGYQAALLDVAGRVEVALVLVAADPEGRLLGGITYLPGPGPLAPFDDPDEAGIRMLAVAPEAQGRGVGALLVAACVEAATAAGKARLSLHTTASMTTAHRLYERAGFRRDPGHDWILDSGLHLMAYVLDLER